ncbi:hypothetical protein ACFV9D_24860 [Streptomyces sp. NPDC059875]|uniref:hypothetical protein n=1 Tax=unclassified Streptomyces TaxID=2593676 RepID=UPI00365115F0
MFGWDQQTVGTGSCNTPQFDRERAVERRFAVDREGAVEDTPPPGGRRHRGLARLNNLETSEKRLVEYLRKLREQLGITSKELGEALTENDPEAKVSEWQLSRYLSGSTLPKLSLIRRMHELLSQRTGRPVDEDAVHEGRALVIAAAEAKGPLMAREIKLEAAIEDLSNQRAHTAEELSQLREAVTAERRHLHELEQELRGMSEQAHRERREITEEQEEIRHRIAHLEDSVRQHEAVLRLVQQERAHVDSMLTATGKEVELWRRREPAPAAAAEQKPTARETAEAIITLREQGSDGPADALIDTYVERASPAELTELSREFPRVERPLENRRLLRAIARFRPARDVLSLVAPPLYGGHRPTVNDPDGLLEAAGDYAPFDELVLLAKLLQETNNPTKLRDLARAVEKSRPEHQLEHLRKVGLPLSRPPRSIPPQTALPEKRRFWQR